LSAGKAILLNYSGWQREIIEQYGAGFGCKLCGLDEFVEKIIYLRDNRHKLPAMGRNGRKIAEKYFHRDKLAKETLEIIACTVNKCHK